MTSLALRNTAYPSDMSLTPPNATTIPRERVIQNHTKIDSGLGSLRTLTGSVSQMVRGVSEVFITEMTEREERPRGPVVYSNLSVAESHFVSLQKWEGAIQQVKSDSFTAVLYDKTGSGPDEEVELPIDEVSEGDLELLTPGAIFYWNIGYHDSQTGQRTRASVIRFRRLPEWNREEINAAQREAARLRDIISWK